jgi:hypothetical protein
VNEDLHVGGVVLRAAPAPEPFVEEDRPLVAEEQLAYAQLLDSAMKIGVLLLTATFLLYVSGVLPPHVPVRDLPLYWSMPVKQHLAATGLHAGWGWLRHVHKGDLLNLVGISFLAGITMFCYAALIPSFFRKRERIYGWLAVVEVVVLGLAASGLISAGAH